MMDGLKFLGFGLCIGEVVLELYELVYGGF